MPTYTWKNKETGEVVEVVRALDRYNVPPTYDGSWERIYNFGVGRVEGGGSPGRQVKKKT